ncbi:MAG: hypothetical protein KBC22_00895 [Candidatus Pacebacteria bacterium]|nr:hypothetical protein [Candidatus Paceibacterota bacterium]
MNTKTALLNLGFLGEIRIIDETCLKRDGYPLERIKDELLSEYRLEMIPLDERRSIVHIPENHDDAIEIQGYLDAETSKSLIILHSEILELPPCLGGPEALLSNAQGKFTGGISPKFTTWGLQHTQTPRPAEKFRIIDINDAKMNFASLLDATDTKYPEIPLSQEQIIMFAQLYPELITNAGLGTLALFKEILNKEHLFFFAQMSSTSVEKFQVRPLRLIDLDHTLKVQKNPRVIHRINHARLIMPYHG